MKAIFKVLALIFTAWFIYSIVVQANDVDPMLWYVIYGVAVLASILFFADKLPYLASVVLFVAYIVCTIVFWPEKFEGITIGEGDIKNIEEGREALGLAITAVILLIYALRLKATKK